MSKLRIVLSLINLGAMIGSVIWFFTSPGWEPGLTAVGLLGALLAQLFTNDEFKSKVNVILNSKGNSHNYISSGHQTITDNKQIQNGGEGSRLVQAQIVNFHGIDEKRAREIYQEMNLQLKKDYTTEALEVAISRVKEFENRLMPKMEAVDGALGAFANPSFQLLLVEAQKAAASTERTKDYDLLAELLIHRFQKGENRIIRAGISRAVEIVDEISDDALLGLTVSHAISTFFPASGDILQGLKVLDELFGKVIYGKLPSDKNWLDHLDILDAVRLNSFGSLKKIEQWYPERLSGYIDVGIEKKSENYGKAVNLLQSSGLPESILVDHALNNDFVRVNAVHREQIKTFKLSQHQNRDGKTSLFETSLSDDQLKALNSVYELYKNDGKTRNENIKIFMDEWSKRTNLRAVKEWWDNIGVSFQITSVGKVLAHSNAQRCDKNLPPLN